LLYKESFVRWMFTVLYGTVDGNKNPLFLRVKLSWQ